jgi:hypothetical protein
VGFTDAGAVRMYFFDVGLIIEIGMPEDILHNPQGRAH